MLLVSHNTLPTYSDNILTTKLVQQNDQDSDDDRIPPQISPTNK